uniref:ACB domain-containing protein n=1 Tax=viral metagenome TaxID=1070528 RepID=A0A6C0KYH9_9ZZZZ|tara:strand:- start:11433 stop:11711 length:279 start_codon:yes stop_codon:yes gene_type:complete
MNKSNLENKFDMSCMLIKTLVRPPSDKDLLYLYGMYKQATIGNCNDVEPSKFNMKQHAKWEAWSMKKDIHKSVAMAFYIAKVDEIFVALNKR